MILSWASLKDSLAFSASLNFIALELVANKSEISDSNCRLFEIFLNEIKLSDLTFFRANRLPTPNLLECLSETG